MRVLLTGATGFVGSYAHPALEAAGHEVRCATRNPQAARSREPARDWVELDVERPETLRAAMKGCDAALYLVHGMQRGDDYPEREASAARDFARAASETGLRRIVYLGGVLPSTAAPSRHLESRRRTGEILRAGMVSTVELRAAMIIGLGSLSWMIVRDLGARLPLMLLPRWLKNHSHPIAVDDVVWALLSALERAGNESRVFELPGAERISHRRMLELVAEAIGKGRVMINLPVLSPRLSSYWIALVTRASLEMAGELVEGLTDDLDPTEPVLWDEGAHQPMGLSEAIRLALDDELAMGVPSAVAIARMRAIGEALKAAR